MPVLVAARLRRGENTHVGLLIDKCVETWRPDIHPNEYGEKVQKVAARIAAELSARTPAWAGRTCSSGTARSSAR